MKPISLITLISILATAGCAHKQPQPPKTHESFSTLIKPDGAKQFSYMLIEELPEGKDSGGRGRGGPDGHRGHGDHGGYGGGAPGDHKGGGPDSKDDSTQDQFAIMFDDAFNSRLNSTSFCHTGFKQLDKQSRRGTILVKGECNEIANNTDREKFPNPAPKKIKVDVLE